MKRLIERRALVNDLVQSKMFDKTKNKLNEQQVKRLDEKKQDEVELG